MGHCVTIQSHFGTEQDQAVAIQLLVRIGIPTCCTKSFGFRHTVLQASCQHAGKANKAAPVRVEKRRLGVMYQSWMKLVRMWAHLEL